MEIGNWDSPTVCTKWKPPLKASHNWIYVQTNHNHWKHFVSNIANLLQRRTSQHHWEIICCQGRREECWGPGQIHKVGPILCEVLDCSVWDFTCSEVCSEVGFCACMHYIPTCQLLSLFSGFRSRSTTYGALANDCAEAHRSILKCALFWSLRQQRKRKAKKNRLTWNPAKRTS